MNIRPTHLIIVGALGLLALTGCNNTETTTQSSSGENSASPVAALSPTSSGYSGLLGVVSSTKAAVEAGDFTKAKTDFAKFEDNWKPVEDGIKAKSSDSYTAIETSLDTVNAEFKGAVPNKEKVLAALNSMETDINKASNL